MKQTEILDADLLELNILEKGEEILWEAQTVPYVFGAYYTRDKLFGLLKEILFSKTGLYILAILVMMFFMEDKVEFLMKTAFGILVIGAILFFSLIEIIRAFVINRYFKSWERRYLMTNYSILIFTGRKWLRVPINHIRDIGFSTIEPGLGSILFAMNQREGYRSFDLVSGTRIDYPSLQLLPNAETQHIELKELWKSARKALN
ncbi:MAG: hypothetical protein AAFV80_16850 [Bacteroidota bacterium]